MSGDPPFAIGYKDIWKLGPRKPEETYKITVTPSGRSKSFEVRTPGGLVLVNGDFISNFTLRDAV